MCRVKGRVLAVTVLAAAVAACAPSTPAAHGTFVTSPPASTSASPAVSAATPAASAFAKWYDDGGKQAWDRLASALVGPVKAVLSGLPAVGRACAKIAAAVQAVQAKGHVPDATVQRWLSDALALFRDGARECEVGADTDNAKLLRDSVAVIDAGSADLTKATAAIAKLG